MSIANIRGGEMESVDVLHSLRFKVNVETLAGTRTMAADEPQMQFLDPGGATRILLLPPEEPGLFFIIKNTAGAVEDLTVKEDSNTTTIATVAGTSAEVGIFFCDGTTWHALVGVP